MSEINNVSFRYDGAEKDTIRNVNLTIHDGECVVLSGGSGCGKTTITRLVNGLIPSFYPGELIGTVKIDGQDISNREPYELSEMVGSVFQNPRTQFFNTDTDSELVFGMENCGIPYEVMHQRYQETVKALHLEKLCARNIFRFIGRRKAKYCIWEYLCLISSNLRIR